MFKIKRQKTPEYNRHFHRTFVSTETEHHAYIWVFWVTMEKTFLTMGQLRSKILLTPELANPYFLIIFPSYTKKFSMLVLPYKLLLPLFIATGTPDMGMLRK